MEALIQEDSNTHAGSSIAGSVILTIAAVIASYPATVFLLQYTADPQKTGALATGGIFAVLAVCYTLDCSIVGLVTGS